MPTDLQPADYVAAFTWDRLIAIATLLFNTRQRVAEDAKPELGDTRTGIGFRAWEQSKFAITKAAANDLADWLSISDEGPRFVFLLGMMPIRFYRGDSDEPVPENYADPSAEEMEQIEIALVSNAGVHFAGYYRMIVKANVVGFPQTTYLVGIDFDNRIRLAWEIPLDAAATTPIIVPLSPVPLPPLNVFTVAEVDDAEKEARERAEAEKAKAMNPKTNEGA